MESVKSIDLGARLPDQKLLKQARENLIKIKDVLKAGSWDDQTWAVYLELAEKTIENLLKQFERVK
jgi:hypothetical protein